MTTKQLTVQNATVTTMTVEVKTLTIGARQVTKGIFRQLIEEPLIAEDGTLNGVPWGHVNDCPGNCGVYRYEDGGKTQSGFDRGHLHVVWQRSEDLRRCVVYSADVESRRLQWRPNSGFFCAWDGYTEAEQQRHRDVRATLAQLPQLFIGG